MTFGGKIWLTAVAAFGDNASVSLMGPNPRKIGAHQPSVSILLYNIIITYLVLNPSLFRSRLPVNVTPHLWGILYSGVDDASHFEHPDILFDQHSYPDGQNPDVEGSTTNGPRFL